MVVKWPRAVVFPGIQYGFYNECFLKSYHGIMMIMIVIMAMIITNAY